MALRIVGRPDFVGGHAHGDEITTDIKFIIDGVETDVTTLVEPFEFKTMTIIQDSKGYDPLDNVTHILNHHKEHKITHAGIRLDQRVEWLGDFTMSHSYLAMMPPAKAYTDMYYTNLTEPAEVDLTTGTKYVDGATSATVYGKDSGLYFTMTVNEYDTYMKPLLSIADNGGGAYNKMYFTFVNDGTVKKGEDAAYVSVASTDDIEAPTRTNAALEGVEFYGTSLLLEDQVTIRHYFAVNDMDAFTAAGYTTSAAYKTKGNYIYFDIVDISAQFMGDAQTFTISDAEGNVVYEIKYSVTNYIKNMMNDDDANLVSLVNAMYDYYIAAKAYTK